MLVNGTITGKEEESRDLVSVDSTDQSIYSQFGLSYLVATQTFYFEVSITERPQRRDIHIVVLGDPGRTCIAIDCELTCHGIIVLIVIVVQ